MCILCMCSEPNRLAKSIQGQTKIKCEKQVKIVQLQRCQKSGIGYMYISFLGNMFLLGVLSNIQVGVKMSPLGILREGSIGPCTGVTF
jgi:hypothetical protein